ncbi:MAG: hypothetical protein AB1736_11245 [Chloroflexota bacterium]
MVTAAWTVAACSSQPTPTGTNPLTAPSTEPPSVGPSAQPTPTSSVVIDPQLLEILPISVDGLDVVESPDAELAALGDPQLEAVAAALAAGIAVDPASGEFVYAVVVRLIPGSLDAAAFRDWRDSYDEGACSQADGVLGHAETEIGGTTVYIGTCVGGLRTYHAWLEARDVLISVSAVGERRLGEHLVENLRP